MIKELTPQPQELQPINPDQLEEVVPDREKAIDATTGQTYNTKIGGSSIVSRAEYEAENPYSL